MSTGFTILFLVQQKITLMYYRIFFLYYFILELFFQQTLGKMFTKTFVVTKDGKKPSFLNILIRSFCRIIPLDALLYLFGSELGMHDKVSLTKLTRK